MPTVYVVKRVEVAYEKVSNIQKNELLQEDMEIA